MSSVGEALAIVQPPPFVSPPTAALGPGRSGFVQGFRPSVRYGLPNAWGDPEFRITKLDRAHMQYADGNVNLEEILGPGSYPAPSGGAPTGLNALHLEITPEGTFPANAYLYNRALIRLTPDSWTTGIVGGALVLTNFSFFYEFWFYLGTGMSGASLYLTIAFYDNNGNFLGSRQNGNRLDLGNSLPTGSWQHLALGGSISGYGSQGWSLPSNWQTTEIYYAWQLQVFGQPVSSPGNDLYLLDPYVSIGTTGTSMPTGLIVAVDGGQYQPGGAAQEFEGGSVTLAAADPTNPRIDLVAWDPTANSSAGGLDYVEGTAAATPVAPVLTGPVAIAQVTVPAGAASLTAADLTDVRGTAGVFTDTNGVTQVSPGVPGGLRWAPLGAVTPPASPLVSGTVYQNTTGSFLTVYQPCYATTAGTAGTVAAALGIGSAPATLYTRQIAGTTAAATPDVAVLRVPPGWFYSFTASGVTLANASIQGE